MTKQELELRKQILREEWRTKAWKRPVILKQVALLDKAYAKNNPSKTSY